MAQNGTEELLTVEEVATRLRYKPATIQGWLRRGQLRGTKVGKEWRIAAQDLEAWLPHIRDHGGEDGA